MGNAIARITDWIIGRISTMPTTNVRIVVTLALVVLTGFVYLGLVIKVLLFGLHNPGTAGFAATAAGIWEPSASWLTFLAAMSGIDALTFAAKRATDATYIAARQSGAITPPAGTAAGA